MKVLAIVINLKVRRSFDCIRDFHDITVTQKLGMGGWTAIYIYIYKHRLLAFHNFQTALLSTNNIQIRQIHTMIRLKFIRNSYQISRGEGLLLFSTRFHLTGTVAPSELSLWVVGLHFSCGLMGRNVKI